MRTAACPGLLLQLAFFVGLIAAMWPLARSDPDPFTRYMASGCALALVGLVIGVIGPSSVLGFAPLWAFYGVVPGRGLVARRGARQAAR